MGGSIYAFRLMNITLSTYEYLIRVLQVPSAYGVYWVVITLVYSSNLS